MQQFTLNAARRALCALPVLALPLALPLVMACGTSSGSAASADARAAETTADAAVPTFVTRLDKSRGQLPEGLWEAPLGDGGALTPIITFAPLAVLETVGEDGSTSPFASLTSAPAANVYTLGITGDSAGALYVGVGEAARRRSTAAVRRRLRR